MFSRIAIPLCFLSLPLLMLAGCDSGPSTGTVTGVVTINGQPIADAVVSFYPTDARASTGKTDAEGKYVLDFTRDRKGAVLGKHKVTIVTEVLPETDYGSDDNYADREGDAPIKRQGVTRRELLPRKYLDRKKTDLTATVEAGENVIDFALTTK